MAKLKPIITTQEKLNTIDIKEGQFICVKDSNSIYIDTDTERLEYTLPRVLNYLQSGNSISIGSSNTIQGDGCVVLGNSNTVSSDKAFILGQNNTVSGECAIPIIGSGNVLPENVTNAVIIGNHSDSLTGITNNCINVGFLNKIIGRGYAYGEGLQTTNDFETALGAYNLSNSDIIFSIGNGTSADNRSNLFTIYKDGKVETNSVIGASITNWQANYSYKINELVIYNNILYQCNVNHTSLETFEENKWNILLSAKDDAFNFNDLSTAMTTGTQSGISVTADVENERFNFEMIGMPTITIDAEGYWTVDGDRGENPTKAQGEKGNDGVSPIASVTKTETGATITITDSSSTTTVDISNGIDGTDGISPHIDESTNHWFVGETDTGIGATAMIDDTSTDGTDVSWSASKINSVISDIGVMNIVEYETYLRSIMKEHYTNDSKNNGTYVSIETRNAIITPQISPRDIYITADSGYNISIQFYSTNKTGGDNFLSNTSWVDSYMIPANTWFCLIIRHANNASTTVNDNNCFNISLKETV